MSMTKRFTLAVLALFVLSACSSTPTARKLKAVKDLNLKVDSMAGGHGGAGTFADFVKAAAPPASSN